MTRWKGRLVIALVLAACAGGEDDLTSSETQAFLLPAGAHIFSERFHIAPEGATAHLGGLAAARADEALLAGTFDATARFGPDTLVSDGDSDVFVVKVDPAGAVEWSRRFGDEQFQEGIDVAAAPGGGAYVLGHFDGTIDFGGGVSLTKAGVEPTPDVFVARLDRAGRGVWARQLRIVESPGILYAVGITSDAEGNVFFTGTIEGLAEVDGVQIDSPLLQSYLVKLDPSGAVAWSDLFLGPDQITVAIDTDLAGNVAVFQEDGRGVRNYLVKWDAGGVRFVDRVYEGTGAQVESAHDMQMDRDGNVLVSGSGRFGQPPGADGEFDLRQFVARLDPLGDLIWIRRLDTEVVRHVAADRGERVVIAGDVFDRSEGAPGRRRIAAFAASLGPGGVPIWRRTFSRDGEISALAVDRQSNPYLGGTFEGTIDFRGGPLTSADGPDLFLARLAR
jgi:hypothetical protein